MHQELSEVNLRVQKGSKRNLTYFWENIFHRICLWAETEPIHCLGKKETSVTAAGLLTLGQHYAFALTGIFTQEQSFVLNCFKVPQSKTPSLGFHCTVIQEF